MPIKLVELVKPGTGAGVIQAIREPGHSLSFLNQAAPHETNSWIGTYKFCETIRLGKLMKSLFRPWSGGAGSRDSVTIGVLQETIAVYRRASGYRSDNYFLIRITDVVLAWDESLHHSMALASSLKFERNHQPIHRTPFYLIAELELYIAITIHDRAVETNSWHHQRIWLWWQSHHSGKAEHNYL